MVRVIDYHLDNLPQADPLYRLITTVLDHTQAPAEELAASDHQRWEIETAFLPSVRVVQRRMARFAAIPPSAEKNLS